MNKNKYLTDSEASHLEALLLSRMKGDRRNALMFLLGLKTGARAQELLNLTKADVNLEDRSIFIKGMKGSNDREIPLHYSVFQALLGYMSSIDGDKLFDITYDRWYQLWLFWRPVKKSPHCLRHTAAIQLLKKTGNVHLVQSFLGHKSIRSTEVYMKYLYTKEELRKAIL